jgi:two-component system KDP operon response regulator KdpE
MTEAMHVILIVEDDEALQSVLRMMFEANRYRVLLAGTAAEGLHHARLSNPDIVMVDLGLPDRDGVEVIIGIRNWSAMPIIVLSARKAESQRLLAFEKGADDYVLKPFSATELLARVRAVSRRYVRGDRPMAVLKLGDITVDMVLRIARRPEGEEIHLTPLEHRILESLARHAGSLITHEEMLNDVWGPNRSDARALRVYIANLRRKLEKVPSQPRHILTELGLGYRLIVDPDS